MNNLNIPAEGKEKICSACLRKMPVKYFLKDGSRSDSLSCNCISCLFPNGKSWKAKFPELWEPGRFLVVDRTTIPKLGSESKLAAVAKAREAKRRAHQIEKRREFETEAVETVN